MKKYFILLILSLVFISCGKEEKTADGTEKIILRFSWWGGNDRHNATLAVIDAYMKEHPNVTIEAEYGGFIGSEKKLKTQIAGGTEADIMQINVPWLSSIKESLIDLSQYPELLNTSGWNKDFLEAQGKLDEKQIALPTGVNGQFLIYNNRVKPLFPSKERMTWDEYFAIGNKINKDSNGKNHAIWMTTTEIDDVVLKRVLRQKANGHVMEDDGTLNITKTDVLEAFRIIKKLYDSKTVDSYKNLSIYENRTVVNKDVMAGKIDSAMPFLSVLGSRLGFYPKKMKWNVMALPDIKNTKIDGSALRAAQLMGVSKNSKNKEESVKFLNYFFNDEEAIKILGTSRGIPATKKATKILTEENKISPLLKKAVEVVKKNDTYKINKYDVDLQVVKLGQDLIIGISLGNYTPEKASELYLDGLKKIKL